MEICLFFLSIEKDPKLAYGFADRRFFCFLSYTMKIPIYPKNRLVFESKTKRGKIRWNPE